MPDKEGLTILLQEMAHGNTAVYQEVFASVYDQLKGMAHNLRWQRQRYETLQTTDIVHEAYLRLAGKSDIDWESQSHFYGVAAKAMRFLLSNHARHKLAEKRGGKHQPVPLNTLNQDLVFTEAIAESLIDLETSLQQLEQLDPRQAKVVEHRFYAGLSIEETAKLMQISQATVKREWTMAKAFLRRALGDNPPD